MRSWLAVLGLAAAAAACGAGPAAPASPEPLVIVTMFADPACPACARALPWIERVQESWPGEVEVRTRYLPQTSHPRATLAARVALAADRAGLRGSHGRRDAELYRLAGMGEPGDVGPDYEARLVRWAVDAGADAARLAAELANPALDETLAATRKVAAALRVPGTPTFFVGGRQLDTSRGFAPLIGAVRRGLGEASAALQEGTPRAAVARAQMRRSVTDPRAVDWLAADTPPNTVGLRPPAPRSARTTVQAASARWQVTLRGDEPTTGPPDALVTVVVFEDLASPFCAELAPALRNVAELHPRDVRIVHKLLPLPFHPEARAWATLALCAAEEGRFEEVRTAAYSQPGAPPPEAPGAATCLTAEHVATRLSQDAGLARRVGAFGTPVIFLNGRKLAGARSASELAHEVDNELASAGAIADRVGRDAVYAELTSGGATRQPLGPAGATDRPPEAPALGADAGGPHVTAWLDLVTDDDRRVLGALLTRLRRGDIALTVHAAPLVGDELSERAAWLAHCAAHAGVALRFLTALAGSAAARHEHGIDDPALSAAAASAGLDEDTRAACPRAAQVPPPAGASRPALTLDGRLYDGSLGYGPGALRRLIGP